MSSLFGSLSQTQIAQFKEAFSIIDQDGDGQISFEDLKGTLQSLGMDSRDATVVQMLDDIRTRGKRCGSMSKSESLAKSGSAESARALALETGADAGAHGTPLVLIHWNPEKIGFTGFLSVMSSALSKIDPVADIVEALAVLDKDGTGHIRAAELREALQSGPNALSDAEFDAAVRGSESGGLIDCCRLASMWKNGSLVEHQRE